MISIGGYTIALKCQITMYHSQQRAKIQIVKSVIPSTSLKIILYTKLFILREYK